MRRSISMLAMAVLATAGLAWFGTARVQACDGPAKAGTEAKASAEAKAPKVFDSPPPVGTRATCPVLGTEFTVTKDTARSEYHGKYVVFCCPGCKPKFDADPQKYL